MAGSPQLSPAAKADAEALMEASRQKVVAHTELAEKTYPQVLHKFDQLQSSGLAEPEKMAQALRDVGGAKADELASSIAQDFDKANFMNAGGRVPIIKNALKIAVLSNEAQELMQKNPNIRIAKITRDALNHADQPNKGVDSSQYAKTAKEANAEIDQFAERLQTLKVAADKQPALDQALGQLEAMKQDFGQFNKPDGYRLTKPTELTPASIEGATHLQEIEAGNSAKALKLVARDLGYQVDSVPTQFGNKAMLPATTEANKALNALTQRRDDLGHLDVKPENPGAIERVRDGKPLLDQLPMDRPALELSLEKPQIIKVSPVAEAANDPVYNQPSAKAAAPAQPASAPAEVPPAISTPTASAPATASPPEDVVVVTSVTSLEKFGRGFGPAALGTGAVVEGTVNAYTAYKHGDGAAAVTAKFGEGAAKGAFDAALPGADKHYADITNNDGAKRTWLDRTLNATSDASQTTAVTASGVALAGVETGPLDLAPAAVAGGAAVVNLGANLLKAGAKVAGIAGEGQDGGYIYDGAALAYKGAVKGAEMAGSGVTKAADWAADKIDNMIFGGQDVQMSKPALNTPAAEPVTGAGKSDR